MFIPWMVLGLGALLFTGLVVMGLARAFLVVVTVLNESMQPTLLHGDRVLVLRHWPGRWLRRGQIVIIWPFPFLEHGPQPFGVPEPFIKRIVGMPGEVFVTYLDRVNQYFLGEAWPAAGDDRCLVKRIPEAHLFACGDNPLGGFDSRIWGPLPFQQVLGVVVLKLTRRAAADLEARPCASASVTFSNKES